jgi:hypothetical protein
MAVDFPNYSDAALPAGRTNLTGYVPAGHKWVVTGFVIANGDTAPQTVVVEKFTGTKWVKLHPGLTILAGQSFNFPGDGAKLNLMPGQLLALTPSKAGVFDFDLSVMDKS